MSFRLQQTPKVDDVLGLGEQLPSNWCLQFAMDPAAPYFGRHGVFFRDVFHLFCVLTFHAYLDFSCALAFRTYLSEKLFAVVAVTEHSALGHGPPRHERNTPGQCLSFDVVKLWSSPEH
jgi:hypothetical protein